MRNLKSLFVLNELLLLWTTCHSFVFLNGDGEKKPPSGLLFKKSIFRRWNSLMFRVTEDFNTILCNQPISRGATVDEIWKRLLLLVLKMFVGASLTTTHIINQRLVTCPQRTPIKPYNGYVLRPRSTLT